MTQKQDILEHMQAGGKLTPLEALSRFGCLSLAARVLDLRKDGYDISSKSLAVKKRTIVSQYWMEVE